MVPSAGVVCLSSDAASSYLREPSSPGRRVFALREGIEDSASFHAAVRASLPLDPPLSESGVNWDAMEDSIWGGIDTVEESRVVIVWPDASKMKVLSSAEFEIALAVLTEVAVTFGDPRVTNGPTKEVLVVLGGDWSD
jgi:hypothetical protein